MEKTIKYLLQEAYVDGYNDAREAAAKEVEGYQLTWHQFADGIPLHSNCYGRLGRSTFFHKRTS